jgi:signal transduction histidine kinase
MYLGTLIISFALLGAVLAQVIRNYFISQYETSLTNSAERIARSIEYNYNFFGMLDTNDLNSQFYNLYRYLNANVVWVGGDYQVIYASVAELTGQATNIYTDELAPLENGQKAVTHDTLNGFYSAPHLSVGWPLMFNGSFAGAVLVSMSMAELEAAVFGMYRIALISLGIATLFMSALIYISSRAISKPLRQINEAAKIIAGGDFDKRIAVKSKDEVGQLAGQFNSMAESLQEQEKIRRSFIANLSHDLRSPLTSMRGFLEAISDGTVPPEQQPYYLNIVMDESERLIKLSNEMLDIHRIQDSGLTAELADFEINALIRKTVMGFERRALEKKITVNCNFIHPEDHVLADHEMLARVLYNLLDNALKFTPDGGEITVETTTEGRKLKITVSDNGRGMTPEEQKRAFDRFYKGDPSRGEDKLGSGLGLSIVKEFIRAHGEQITVASEEGKGSVFAFTLQLAG